MNNKRLLILSLDPASPLDPALQRAEVREQVEEVIWASDQAEKVIFNLLTFPGGVMIL